MSNNLKRAIKYNRVKGYWYLEGSNHSEYRQLQNGERLTTIGTVQYFSNGTKKYLAKPKPNINVVVNNLWKFENAQNNGFNPKTKTYRPYRTLNGNLDVANGIDLNYFQKNYLPIRKVAPPDSQHREQQSQPQD